jgi:uncharacterized protein YprB with RNaseH-like and TPR domain
MERIAYLDIETSWQKKITVIGVYRPTRGTSQLVAPDISRRRLLDLLNGVRLIYTYNGGRFDLPVIDGHLGINLAEHFEHRDLMFDCWRNKLKGGLKAVEKRLGIHRDTEGIDGLAAMNLWSAHRKGNPEALEILLRYNREDVENLEILAGKLGVLPDLDSLNLFSCSAGFLSRTPSPPRRLWGEGGGEGIIDED